MGIDYDLVFLTLDPGWNGTEGDYSTLHSFFARLNVPYEVLRTRIGQVVFDARHEKNPCSLCAKMRRGALHDAAKRHGCNKIALGHHYDDAVETFVMNLFQEGRIGCFSPVTYLSRKDLTVIRPLVFAPEHEIAAAVRKAGFPVIKNPCPADGATRREWTKNWLRQMEYENRGITDRIFGAMKRAHVCGW